MNVQVGEMINVTDMETGEEKQVIILFYVEWFQGRSYVIIEDANDFTDDSIETHEVSVYSYIEEDDETVTLEAVDDEVGEKIYSFFMSEIL